ncbi:MAG: alpha/beta fold hydrolase [Mycobacteriaceae bacterium]|nr:alpha/beta fold hydrolase [Mycobacteriaceae bacterium]
MPGVAPVGRPPAGRVVELPGRGTTYVVDSGPAPGRPTFVLLHSVACTGLLTWYPSLAAMREFGRVVVFDQRWHGAGITSPRFLLEDCADDVAALADELDIPTFVPIGYSMGSLIAQLAWQRHRDRVDALVLCAAAAAFGRAAHERVAAGIGAVLLEAFSPQPRPGTAPLLRRADQPVSNDRLWAVGQFRRTSHGAMLRALAEISRFDSRSWIADIDVPTAVVIPRYDRLIPARHQQWLAGRIPGAQAVTVAGGHACCTLQSAQFVPGLRSAVDSVVNRMMISAEQTFDPRREGVG